MGIARGSMSHSSETQTQTGGAQIRCNSNRKGKTVLKGLVAQPESLDLAL